MKNGNMAQVRSFSKVTLNSTKHPTEVDAHWGVILTDDERLFQMSTFGSDGRSSKPKVSQTLQFNEKNAKSLFLALKESFNF